MSIPLVDGVVHPEQQQSQRTSYIKLYYALGEKASHGNILYNENSGDYTGADGVDTAPGEGSTTHLGRADA